MIPSSASAPPPRLHLGELLAQRRVAMHAPGERPVLVLALEDRVGPGLAVAALAPVGVDVGVAAGAGATRCALAGAPVSIGPSPFGNSSPATSASSSAKTPTRATTASRRRPPRSASDRRRGAGRSARARASFGPSASVAPVERRGAHGVGDHLQVTVVAVDQELRLAPPGYDPSRPSTIPQRDEQAARARARTPPAGAGSRFAQANVVASARRHCGGFIAITSANDGSPVCSTRASASAVEVPELPRHRQGAARSRTDPRSNHPRSACRARRAWGIGRLSRVAGRAAVIPANFAFVSAAAVRHRRLVPRAHRRRRPGPACAS